MSADSGREREEVVTVSGMGYVAVERCRAQDAESSSAGTMYSSREVLRCCTMGPTKNSRDEACLLGLLLGEGGIAAAGGGMSELLKGEAAVPQWCGSVGVIESS